MERQYAAYPQDGYWLYPKVRGSTQLSESSVDRFRPHMLAYLNSDVRNEHLHFTVFNPTIRMLAARSC